MGYNTSVVGSCTYVYAGIVGLAAGIVGLAPWVDRYCVHNFLRLFQLSAKKPYFPKPIL
jgi:hypothetical protein